jgi:AcrR family transcriptional regulator
MTFSRGPRNRPHRARRGSGELLRTEILTAARDLLNETGSVDAVSVRAVATRVGVTPPSIYLHFEDKDALIQAVCSEIFEHLDGWMREATEGVENPLEIVRRQGMAYVKFALANPEEYRVATMVPRTDVTDMDDTLGSAAFSHVLASVQACVQAGYFGDRDPLMLTFQLWSSVHGMASLMIAKPFLEFGDTETFVNQALRSLLLGHSADAALNGPSADEIGAWINQLHTRVP